MLNSTSWSFRRNWDERLIINNSSSQHCLCGGVLYVLSQSRFRQNWERSQTIKCLFHVIAPTFSLLLSSARRRWFPLSWFSTFYFSTLWMHLGLWENPSQMINKHLSLYVCWMLHFLMSEKVLFFSKIEQTYFVWGKIQLLKNCFKHSKVHANLRTDKFN